MRKRFSRWALVRLTLLLAVVAALAVCAAAGVFGRGSASARHADYAQLNNSLAVDPGEAAAVKATPLVSGPDAVVPKGSGTLGPGSLTATWDGDDVLADTAGPAPEECDAPADPPANAGRCDDFTINVSTVARSGQFVVDVTFLSAEDYDLHVYDKDGVEVGSSAGTSTEQEHAIVPCPSAGHSPYKVRVVYFQSFPDTRTYHSVATYTDSGPCPAAPTPTYVNDGLAFAPSTLVSAHFLGVEPQVTVERTNAPGVPAGNPGGLSDSRIFIDWPLSSRSNIGQLNRSVDAGDSFRLLFDQTCAARSRPMCLTGGGGDTEADVNVKNGHVFFSDQEVLANEAFAASTDHGDSFAAQTAIANATSATDRQWIGGTDSSTTIQGQTIESFFSYHVPPQAYIHAVPESTHLPLPQPVPQLTNTAQTGQMKVDNNPASPGHGWIYYPYNGYVLGGGALVAVANSTAFQLPTNWVATEVSTAAADSFPWVAIDAAGNAYLTWDTGGNIYFAYSPIADVRNNPSAGGRPGTVWSESVKVNPPTITSTIFPEVIGGNSGMIGVTYLGTDENIGNPNNADPDDDWHTYAAVITGANTSNPTITTGRVSHRTSHQGNICTNGTVCGITGPPTEDRSLADMIDVGVDAQGRLGIVFQDNYTESFQDNEATPDTSPFVYFAKQTFGPTLTGGSVNVVTPTGAHDDPAGDAKWPNTSAGTNIPGLDLRRASINIEGANLVARLRLADASTPAMTGAITQYNATACTAPCQAQRLQYIARFNTVDEAFHLSLEVLPNGTMRAFGGKLDTNDGIANPGNPQSIIAAGYHTDAGYTVTPTVTPGPNGEIVLSAPASQFGLANGSKVLSVTGLATAGPLEQLEAAGTTGNPPQTAVYIMRTVDASPPFDHTLGQIPTSVTLRSFRAAPTAGTNGRAVTIRWQTGAASGLLGFNLYRVTNASQKRLNPAIIPGKQGARSYSFRDRLPKGVKASCYRLQAVQLDGSRRWLARTCTSTR